MPSYPPLRVKMSYFTRHGDLLFKNIIFTGEKQMVISTFRQLSEIIQTEHYGGLASPSAEISQRHIAQLIATKIAKYATISAYKNSNGGDTTFADDQFISVFYSQPLLTDDITGDKYVVMPATPTSLPKNSEIAQVSFTGSPNVQCIACQQKDTFMESFYTPLPSAFQLYKIENGNIVFINLPAIINSTVNLKLIGAISKTGDFMDGILNIDKATEDSIRQELLQELAQIKGVTPPKLVGQEDE